MTEFIGALFDISIHALLAESDLPVFLSGFWAYLFLSTLSLRRATHCIWILCRQHPDFYPRSPCGERRGSSSKSTRCLRISIHALLAESDAWCMSRKTPVQAAFLSTLSLRRATLPETAAVVPSRQFLSTLSLRRATELVLSLLEQLRHFYPRSPCGERQDTAISALDASDFYPRSPCGERRPEYFLTWHFISISIHALLAESDLRVVDGSKSSIISIHALLAESDRAPPYNLIIHQNFYPRSPCGERRAETAKTSIGDIFLSTLSLRRATIHDFSALHDILISIHALLAESDPGKVKVVEPGLAFLSTLSLRRATILGNVAVGLHISFLSTLSLRRATHKSGQWMCHNTISIHALLAESDPPRVVREPTTRQFLSTLSLRRATLGALWVLSIQIFLSTLSLRRATYVCQFASAGRLYFYPRSPCGERRHQEWSGSQQPDISIHALLAESDFRIFLEFLRRYNFYPRSPCGERPPMTLRHCTTYLFLSTLSLRRATLAPKQNPTQQRNFYPRSPCGERPMQIVIIVVSTVISIHALLAESDRRVNLLGFQAIISIHALLAESD